MCQSHILKKILSKENFQVVHLTEKIKCRYSNKFENSVIVYQSPCGIRIYNLHGIASYLKVFFLIFKLLVVSFFNLFRCLKATGSNLTVDLFTFDKKVRPNIYYRSNAIHKLMDDFTNGAEAIPIAVYNEVDKDHPPEVSKFFSPLN